MNNRRGNRTKAIGILLVALFAVGLVAQTNKEAAVSGSQTRTVNFGSTYTGAKNAGAYSNLTLAGSNGNGWQGSTTCALPYGTYGNYLWAHTFSFSLPAGATPTGVVAVVTGKAYNPPSLPVGDYSVKLVDNTGAVAGSNTAVPTAWTTTYVAYTYGNVTYTWGTALTSAEVNSANFGVAVACKSTAASGTEYAYISGVTMTIYYTTYTAPPTPALSSPSNGATVGIKPVLEWLNVSSNTYNNPISYNMEVSTVSNYASTSVNMSWSGQLWYSTVLTAYTTYYWRVRAKDAAGVMSAWSSSCTFVIGTAPTTPTLSYPGNNSVVGIKPVLEWNNVSSSSYSNPISYNVEGSTVKTFASTAFNQTWQGQLWYNTTLTTVGVYYWRARAKDATGIMSAWSGTWQFTIIGTATPNLANPQNDYFTNNDNITFSWQTIFANYLGNPSFEYGNMSGWTLTSAASVVSTHPYSGQYELQIGSNSGGYAGQPFSIDLNRSVITSFAVSTTEDANVWIIVESKTSGILMSIDYLACSAATWSTYYHQNLGWIWIGNGTNPYNGRPTAVFHICLADGNYHFFARNLTSDVFAANSEVLSNYNPIDYIFIAFSYVEGSTVKTFASTGTYFDDAYIGYGTNYVDMKYYQLQLATDSDFTTNIQTFSIYGLCCWEILTPNYAYYWHVRSVDWNNIVYSWSATRSFTIDTTPPVVPILRYPTNSSTNGYTPSLIWNATTDVLSGVAKYQVQLSNSSSFAYKFLNVNTTNVWYQLLTPLTVQYKYYWRVRAIDNAGNIGSWCSNWTFFVGDSLQVIWEPQNPSTIYQSHGTEKIGFEVECVNGTVIPPSAYTFKSVSWDNLNDPTGNWAQNGNYYERTLILTGTDMSAHRALGMRSLMVDVNRTGFIDGESITYYTVYQYALEIVNWVTVSSIYQPSTFIFGFQIENGSTGTYFGNTQITSLTSYIDNHGAFTFTYNGVYWVCPFDSTTYALGYHTIVAGAYKQYYTVANSSQTFLEEQYNMNSYWTQQPPSVYQPGSITFKVKVNATGISQFTDGEVIVEGTLDSLTQVALTWNGVDGYAITFDSTLLSVATHTLHINATHYASWYTIAWSSISFDVLNHYLAVHWLDQTTPVYKPNTVLYSLSVSDELGNYFSNITVSANVAGVNAAFTWNGVDRYAWSNSSTYYLTKDYYITVTASLQWRTGATSQVKFTIMTSHLTIEWFSAPTAIYKPATGLFAFKVKDDFGTYYSTISMSLNKMDGSPVTFAWNGSMYVLTVNSMLYLNGWHTVFINATKTYYTGSTDSKTFLVDWYHLCVGSWTGATNSYYPTNYAANFTLRNEVGFLNADTVVVSVDGMVYPLFSMSLTRGLTGHYALVIPVWSSYGYNLWGSGNHTIFIIATKLGMATGNSSYIFSLGYRKINIRYVWVTSLNYDYKYENYTFKIDLNTYVLLSQLSWTFTADGVAVPTSNYTIQTNYVMVYATLNLTAAVHTLVLDVKSSNALIAETTDTAYVTLIAPGGIAPVILLASNTNVQLWGQYQVSFIIQSYDGKIWKDANITISVYNQWLNTVKLYQVNPKPDSMGVYTFSVTPYQVGVTGSYNIMVYINKTGYTRESHFLTSFTVTDSQYNLINYGCIFATYIITSGAFVQWADDRRRKQFGDLITNDVFDFSGKRFIFPLLGSAISLAVSLGATLLIHGLNLFSVAGIAVVVLNVVTAILIYMVVRLYYLYDVISAVSIGLSVFAIYWYYFIMGLGFAAVTIIAPSIMTMFYLLGNSLTFNSFELKKLLKETEGGSDKTVKVPLRQPRGWR